MATWTYSQPMPRARWRRFPVIRCPSPAIRPSFLDIDVEQLAGPCAFVEARQRVERPEPGEAQAAQEPADGSAAQPDGRRDPARPSSAAAAGARPEAPTAAGVARRDLWGRQERSRSPAGPSCCTRRHHFVAVRSEIPKAWATAATG